MRLIPISPPSKAKVEPHPFSKIMPPMSDEERRDLAQDIGKNGVLQPIIVYQGKILDGNHRFSIIAAYEFKKPVSFVEFEGTDAEAKAFVISANIHRRHLTPETRREIIKVVLQADPTQSNRVIAETTKTSHHTVEDVRQEMEATGQIAQLEKTTGKDGKTRKKKSKKSGGGKTTIQYLEVVNSKTAQNAYGLLEEHLLNALQDVQKYFRKRTIMHDAQSKSLKRSWASYSPTKKKKRQREAKRGQGVDLALPLLFADRAQGGGRKIFIESTLAPAIRATVALADIG